MSDQKTVEATEAPKMTTPLPRNEYGEINCSAVYGGAYIVEIEHSTDFDGRRIDGEKEEWAKTFHGPFLSEEEANEWICAYPEFDDLEEMIVVNLNYVRPNATIQGES